MQAHERYEGGTFGHYGRIMGGKTVWQREKNHGREKNKLKLTGHTWYDEEFCRNILNAFKGLLPQYFAEMNLKAHPKCDLNFKFKSLIINCWFQKSDPESKLTMSSSVGFKQRVVLRSGSCSPQIENCLEGCICLTFLQCCSLGFRQRVIVDLEVAFLKLQITRKAAFV